MEAKLACVEQKRSRAPKAKAIARLRAGMQSPDEQIRARAVRQVCPCRLPWEVFSEVQVEAKRLQHDPGPLVRAQAQHVQEDARELTALEALQNWTEERDDAVGASAPRSERRGRRRPSHRRWSAEDET